MGTMQQESSHRGHCRFPVCACHTNGSPLSGYHPQHLCPFMQLKADISETSHLAIVGRNCRRINDQCGLHIQEFFRNIRLIIPIADNHPLFLPHFLRQGGGSPVITGNPVTARLEVTRQGAHSDTADAQKINVLYAFIHDFLHKRHDLWAAITSKISRAIFTSES